MWIDTDVLRALLSGTHVVFLFVSLFSMLLGRLTTS